MANTSGIRAGRAFVELGVDDRLRQGLRAAQRRLTAFGSAVQSAGLRMVGLGAAIAAPLGLAARQFANTGDAVAKMARRTGMSTEAVAALGFAAEQSGTDMATLEKGVRRMQMTINDAERGLSTARDAFADLGVTAGELRAMTPERQFERLAEAISQVPDPSKRAALAMQVFGRAGTMLLPLFAEGVRGMRSLREEARRLGLTIDAETAAKAEVLSDALNRARRAMKTVTFHVGGALAPILSTLSDRVAAVAARIGAFVRENRALIVLAAKVAAGTLAAAGGLLGLGVAIKAGGLALGGLALALKAASGLFAAMVSPIGLAVGSVVALGAAIAHWTAGSGRALAWLRDRFAALSQFVGGVFRGIADALRAGDIRLAAEVLWAGLKGVWAKGALELRKAWEAIWLPIVNAATIAFGAIQTAWIRVQAFLQTAIAELENALVHLWLNLGAKLPKSIQKLVFGVELDEQTLRGAKGLQRADIERQRQERQARQAAALEAVRAATRARLAAQESGGQARIDAAEAELKAAQQRLGALRAAARERRRRSGERNLGVVGLSMRIAENMRRSIEQAAARFRPGIAGVAQARRRFSTVGTFNKAALFGLAGGGRQEQLLQDIFREVKRNREVNERNAHRRA